MALSKREIKILWLTGIVVAGVALWQIVLGPSWDAYTTQQEALESERAKYIANVETLNKRREIEEGFRKIEASFPKEDPDRVPEDAFSEDAMFAAQTILPGRVPQPGRLEREEIPDVEDYEILTFPITSVGELENIALLLKGFDQKGFLVKNLMITHAKSIDDPDLRLEITLARIVKVDQPEMRPSGLGLRRGSISGGRP